MPQERNEKRVLTAFESDLAALVPRVGWDRDRILFEAGRASVDREHSGNRAFQRHAWPLATAASLLVAIGAAWWSVNKPPQTIERVVRVEGSPGEPRPLVQHRRELSPEANAAAYVAFGSAPAWQHATGDARTYFLLRDQLASGAIDIERPQLEVDANARPALPPAGFIEQRRMLLEDML